MFISTIDIVLKGLAGEGENMKAVLTPAGS